MIHYTLLPEKEAKELKYEYHIRVFIVLMFFVSCSFVVGIISLAPAYVVSSTREKELNDKLQEVQKSKIARGVDVISKEMEESTSILNRLKAEDRYENITSIVAQIANTRDQSIKIDSIQVHLVNDESKEYEIVMQGKSVTREDLFVYKKKLEKNPAFVKVDFPIPDLTKNKEVPFAVRMKLKQIQ